MCNTILCNTILKCACYVSCSITCNNTAPPLGRPAGSSRQPGPRQRCMPNEGSGAGGDEGGGEGGRARISSKDRAAAPGPRGPRDSARLDGACDSSTAPATARVLAVARGPCPAASAAPALRLVGALSSLSSPQDCKDGPALAVPVSPPVPALTVLAVLVFPPVPVLTDQGSHSPRGPRGSRFPVLAGARP